MNEQIVALVLAAGNGSRFGSDKRRAAFHDTTLLQATLRAVNPCFRSVTVVIRPDDTRRALNLPQCVQLVHSARSKNGMGFSLADGVRVLASADISAIAVFLGDMPWIKPDTINQLIAFSRPDNIVVPEYLVQRGHPVIFGRQFFPDLMKLTGDSGAKSLLSIYGGKVLAVSVSEQAVIRDVDKPEDIH